MVLGFPLGGSQNMHLPANILLFSATMEAAQEIIKQG
jgi:hypothetical protein